MNIRKTTAEDLDAVMEIIDAAKAYFKGAGIDQWQRGTPDRAMITKDIENGCSYVLCDEGSVLGTCMILFGVDPNYAVIENGAWLNDEPYGVIHRIAVRPECKGRHLAAQFFDYAQETALQQGVHNLRVDTHADNKSMQKLIARCGFTLCGKVYVGIDEPRLAFQKAIG